MALLSPGLPPRLTFWELIRSSTPSPRIVIAGNIELTMTSHGYMHTGSHTITTQAEIQQIRSDPTNIRVLNCNTNSGAEQETNWVRRNTAKSLVHSLFPRDRGRKDEIGRDTACNGKLAGWFFEEFVSVGMYSYIISGGSIAPDLSWLHEYAVRSPHQASKVYFLVVSKTRRVDMHPHMQKRDHGFLRTGVRTELQSA